MAVSHQRESGKNSVPESGHFRSTNLALNLERILECCQSPILGRGKKLDSDSSQGMQLMQR